MKLFNWLKKKLLRPIKVTKEEICEHCESTYYSGGPVNTNQYNICYGKFCEEAENDIIDQIEDYNNRRCIVED